MDLRFPVQEKFLILKGTRLKFLIEISGLIEVYIQVGLKSTYSQTSYLENNLHISHREKYKHCGLIFIENDILDLDHCIPRKPDRDNFSCSFSHPVP